ncbi:MAG: alpha-glucan family phosphorylase [Gammaproteobacteria bacterium]|nr:alpha-glucan family phosphorylase [Gammaproteobacteria bacterium]
MKPGTVYNIEINPEIPAQLARLPELANDLYYSWDRHLRGLFFRLDRSLWESCGHNPKVLLRRVSQQRLDEAAEDRTFLESYHRALANYDTYRNEDGELTKNGTAAQQPPLVTYFCAEFGLHESLPIYSGGLGILAGDFCKAASDIGLPFIAVGLLYRQGNFVQTIDATGQQHMQTLSVANADLPMTAAKDGNGNELVISVPLKDEHVQVKVWQVKAGHIDLYLLDTDIDANPPHLRAITHTLYPSDKALRLTQEIILGIGGVAALRAMNLEPDVWHINEGHPALQILARCRRLIETGHTFATALEIVAASTVFTTHTPVSAGHEIYTPELVEEYLGREVMALGLDMTEFLALGQSASHGHQFNMTAFAIRASRFHNGVSRIHGGVAAQMESYIWPEVPVDENPMDYVTNGVHVPTFMAREWISALGDAGWRNEIRNPDYWETHIQNIPDPTFWSIRLKLKAALIGSVRRALAVQARRNGLSAAQVDRQMAVLESGDDVLMLGFARRFATYKRGTLLFADLPRLERLLNDPQRPTVILFAGRAHPSDKEGQALIKEIQQHANNPALFGKIIMLEGYDLALARNMVAGVDVWVNNPEYPMEASGTSGMKAAINAVVNLSVMDGWWAEGYDGGNGFGVEPHPAVTDVGQRRWLEAKELLDILETSIIPTYFNKTGGMSPEWLQTARRSAMTILPRFNAQRMVIDYYDKFYLDAAARRIDLQADGDRPARELAQWRAKVRHSWSGVSLHRSDKPLARVAAGNTITVAVDVNLAGLDPNDITVEVLFSTAGSEGNEVRQLLQPGAVHDGKATFQATFEPPMPGLLDYRIRAYPFHPLLCHPFEMGCMKWL